MYKRLSIRIRLGLLILVAVLPALVFICFGVVLRYKEAHMNALIDLEQFTKAFSNEQDQTVEAARQLLVAISASPEVNSGEYWCSVYLKNLLGNYSRYANFGVSDKYGNVVCSGVKTSGKINVSDRQFFKNAIETKKFSIGEYQIGSITKKAVLNFGYPITDAEGSITSVVFSSLDLSWINQYVANIETESEDVVLLLLDGNGVVLARSPEPNKWVGESFIKDPLIETILSKGKGTTDIIGLDNIKRIYSFQKLEGADPINPVYVVVGRTRNAVFKDADSNFRSSIIVLILLMIFVAIASWEVGKLFIIKKIEDLEELDKLKSEFVSIASHQLRTPLSAINWFTELIKDEKLTGVQKKIMKNIGESNQRMIDLVESLLNVSRIESDRLKIENKAVDVREILRESINEHKAKAKEKSQKIKLAVGKRRLMVYLDPKLLFQAVGNVIGNAIKYTRQKGLIEISANSKKDRVIITVKDNGYGIPKKNQDKIFQKFFRADNIAEYDIEGTGLGLYISKSIIQKIGGKISFISTEGKGTSFFIFLPKMV
jgi:signal transduction histidine kinase